MKETLQLFRARWLLLVAVMLSVLGVQAQETWYLFDSYVANGQTRATFENPDADGNYVVESFTTVGARSNNFGFVNSPNPGADNATARFLGTDPSVTVREPGTYDLVEIDYDTLYGDQKCFTIGDGDEWVITFNPTTMKVTFSYPPAPELPEEAPATLYLVDYDKSYGASDNNGSGVFEFKGVEIPAQRYPYYGFSDTLNPRSATVMASAAPAKYASAANNLNVELDKVYEIALSSWDAINDMIGSFVIEEGLYDITVDWTNRTVTFTKGKITLPPAPDTLYLVDYKEAFGSATNDGNGIYKFESLTVPENQYPYYGFANSSVPNGASLIVCPVSAAEATGANNAEIEYDKEYPVVVSSWSSIDGCIGSYKINPGVYDITIDWIAMTVKFTKPVINAPEEFYLVDFQKSYGSATNNGGVYKFETVTVPTVDWPYFGFADNSDLNKADYIFSAVDAAEATTSNNVVVEVDQEYPLELSSYDTINANKGAFKINPGTYDITIDWDAMTVKFEKAVMPAPDELYLIDFQTSFGKAINNGQGIFEFEDVTPTSGFPYYGFAPTDNPNDAPWALGTVDYATAEAAGHHGGNIDVVLGEEYTFEFTSPNAFYDELASFVLGGSTINITLDWNKQTVKFYTKPLEQPANLYATDTYLEDTLGSCSNDGNGMFHMVVDVDKSSSLVVFTSSKDFKNEEGETKYYGTADGKISNVEYETEYTLGMSDYSTVWGDQTGLVLTQGRYKLDIDFVAATIVVHDISRGDVWVTPATLNMYNDEMDQVAAGNRTEEGVFQFDNVELKKATNIVFTDDPTATGKFFGSSMKGERSLEVKNYRTYDLYIPTYQEITIDGLAGFMVPAGKWSIKVDMNNKNVSFVDSEATYIPEQLDVVVNGETTSNLANGEGNYLWKVTVAEESEITFSDPLIGRTYGSPEEAVNVTEGTEYAVAELAEDALHAFKVPAGTWEVVMDLKKGKIIFYEYQSISLVESTYKDGDKFYSYYGAGTEPTMTLTFSGNPYTIAEAYLAMGDYTPGMKADTETCTIEKVNVYRSGNTLFTSFAGKVRSIPEGAQPKVTFVVSTIKSVHGLLADTEAIEGLPAGSLMFTFDFEEFQPIAIESKLLDAEGNAVSADDALNVDEMESVTLMVKPFNLITFDGVSLTAAAAEEAEDAAPETLSLNWKVGEEDADGFTPIHVTLPMSIRGAGRWNLSLANLNADDNSDTHGAEVNYAIESLVHPADVVTANPENGATVDELQYIVVKWDHSLVKAVGYKGTEEPKVIVTGDNGDSYPAKLEVINTLAGNELQIHISKEIVNAGTYKVVIPAGTVVLNNNEGTNVNDIELEYQVSGVSSADSILADDPDAEVIVCTISGIVLRKGRAADVISNLKEGIYIINGEKVHIRK